MYASVIAALTLFSCSNNQEYDETLKLNSDQLSEKTSGGTCGTAVNFQDLVVETSWTTGDTSDRDTFTACGVDDENWMDKYSNGNVTLKCLSGDGHRTELKEDSGDEAGLWSNKKMNFNAVYTDIPENGVTIAQVHNRHDDVERPFIRVYIDDDLKIKIKRTNTNMDDKDKEADYTTWISSYTYSAGQNLSFRSEIKGGKVIIIIWHNNKKFQKYVSPTSNWSDYAQDYYYKAGLYTEGNDKEVKVEYSWFELIH